MASNLGINILIQAKDQASAVFSKLSGTIGTSQKSMSDKALVAAGAFASMGAIATTALVASAKTAIEWESAFAGVVKTYEAVSGSAEDTSKELDQINQRFKDMTTVIPVSYVELSKIGELAGQLGVRGVDNMSKFVETVAKISVATNLTSEQAATDFARIANVMQEPLENVDKMGATIVDLGNNFATTEVEISNFAQRIAGAGKIAGLTTAEVFAIGTAMSSVGVEAEAGGTAVQKVLIDMNTAVIKGGKDLGVFAKTAGLSAQQFQKLWREDAGQAFALFVEGLGKSGDNAITILEDLGLQDQRLIRGFLSLANAGDLMTNALNRANTAWSEGTALNEEAEKRFATTASQLQLLKQNVALIAATLGEKLLPIINQVVQALIPYAEKVAKFISEHPKLTVGILAVVAALGAIGTAVLILTPIIGALATTLSFLGTVLGLVLSPIGLIIIAIIALIAAGIWLWQNWDLVKAKANELWVALQAVWAGIVASVMTMVNNVVMWFAQMWTNIVTGAQAGWTMITTFISNLVTSIINFFLQLPMTILNIILQTGENILLGLAFIAGFLYVMIPVMIQFIIDWFAQLPTRISEFLTNMQTAAIDIWNSFLAATIALVTQLITDVSNWFAQLPTRVSEFLTQTQQKGISIWNSFLSATISLVTNMINSVVNWFAQLPSRVSQWIESTKTSVMQKWEELKTSLIDGTKAMIDGAVNLFKELPAKVLAAIGDLAAKVRDKIVGAFKSGVEAANGLKLKISGYQYGGIVNAPVGKPQLAIVHGGENITPNHSDRNVLNGGNAINSNSGGGGLHVHIHTSLFTGSKTEIRNVAQMLYDELAILARSQSKSVAEYMGA